MPVTKDLANILSKLNPVKYRHIIERAAANGYHDYKYDRIIGHPEYGETACPKLQLVEDLSKFPELQEIRQQVIDGLYDEIPDQDDQQALIDLLLEDNAPDAMFKSMGFPVPTFEQRQKAALKKQPH